MRTSFVALSWAGLFVQLICLTSWAGFSENHRHPNVRCESKRSGLNFKVCVYENPNSTNTDVLYQLHGLGGNELQFFEDERWIRTAQIWGDNSPKVVTVSYGRFWLLAQQNSSRLSGLFEHFVNTIMPLAESELGVLNPTRIVLGVSMGGFNASQLYLKRSDLFSRVVLACPAITEVGPHSTNDDVRDYARRTGAQASRIYSMRLLSRQYFPEEADWKQASPLELIRSAATANFSLMGALNQVPVYVSCGDQDEYGFQEGAETFAHEAAQLGLRANWERLSGAHCTVNEPAIAAFLVPSSSRVRL